MLYAADIFDYRIPIPNLFNGSTDNGTGCTAGGGEFLDCFNAILITDGDFGPPHSLSMNLHRFIAWNRTRTQPVTLQFGFLSSVSSLSGVVLYFYNSPAQRIGLPVINLRATSGGSPFNITYFYENNNALTSSDSQLRNVSLSITSNTDNSVLLFIDLMFTNTDIDWILLSEVDVSSGMCFNCCYPSHITVYYAGTPASIDPMPVPMDITFQDSQSQTVSLGPDNPQSSVRLSCTVTVSGLFQWTWLHNGNTVLSSDRYQILTGDATRSSILVINKLRYTDEGTYSCVVNRVSQTSNSVRNITLELLGELCSTSATIVM